MGSTEARVLAKNITDAIKSSIWQPGLEIRIGNLVEDILELNEAVNKAHGYLVTRAVTTPNGPFYAKYDPAEAWVRAALLEFIEAYFSEELQLHKKEGN